MGDPKILTALARLRQDCIQAKEALSVDTETTIPVFLPSGQFDVRLTRSDFEDLVRAQIETTIGALSRTLESAQVTPAELSAVLLIGGSSRIPLVTRMVAAELRCPTVVDTHPKQAQIATGIALLLLLILIITVKPFKIYRMPSGSSAPTPAVRNTAAIQVGQTPGFVAVAPNGRQAYITDRDAHAITTLDTATHRVVATIPVIAIIPIGRPPSSIALTPNAQQAYVTNPDRGTVTVLDLTDN